MNKPIGVPGVAPKSVSVTFKKYPQHKNVPAVKPMTTAYKSPNKTNK